MPSGTVDKPGSGSSLPLTCRLSRETNRQLPINCIRIEAPLLVTRLSAAVFALAHVLNANNAPARSVNAIVKAPGNRLRYGNLFIWTPTASYCGNRNLTKEVV